MAESIDERVTREILSSLAKGHIFVPSAFQGEIYKRIQAAIDEAVQAEREACAKIAETLRFAYSSMAPGQTSVHERYADNLEIAAAIRARGAKNS